MPVDGAGAVFTPPVSCGSGSTCQLAVDILHPRVASHGKGWPVIVAVPGGPGPLGIRHGLGTFAQLLAGQGAVVFVADYREGPEWGGGAPASYEDIGCAIRFARATAAEYGGDGSRVVLVAHSFGPFVASVEALSHDPFTPPAGSCLVDSGSTKPDAFVGISGIYSQTGVTADYLASFFGGDQASASSAWSAGDPYQVIRQPDAHKIPIRLIHGTADTNVRIESSQQFEAALQAGGWDVQLVTVEGGDHSAILQQQPTIATVMETAVGLK